MSQTPGRRNRVANRVSNLVQVFRQTRQVDPRMLPLVLGVAGVALVLFALLAVFLGPWWVYGPLGVLLALVVGLQVFSLRAQRAAMRAMSGRPGAAAQVMSGLRRPWKVTPGIAFNRRQDFVHLAVGRPGVVLVAEGAPSGAKSLLKQERRRVQRVVGDTPVHELNVGGGDGQLPLGKLQTELMKLPKSIKPPEVDALAKRLATLGSSTPPMPKGPLPGGGRRPKLR